MNNFLYIAFYFPPLAGPASRHNLGWVTGLSERGFTPTVITVTTDIEYPHDDFLLSRIPNALDIRRFPWPYRFNPYTNRLRDILKIPENPLVFKGSNSIYETAIRELSEHAYRFIYTVSGIAAGHLAGLRLKKETGLRWVAEFRDPWVHSSFVRKYLADTGNRWWYSYQQKKTDRLLSDVVHHADLIVVESPTHGDLLIRDFGLDKNKVVPYGMGYDETLFTEKVGTCPDFPKRPVIGFVGSLYHGSDRDVKTLMVSMKELERKGYEFTVVTVGGPVNTKINPFERHASEAGLANYIPIDRVNVASALTLMRLMDFGMVITLRDYPSHINSKLWEYLHAGLTIIGLVPEQGDMAKIIKEGNCGYILPYTQDGMMRVLENALDDYREGKIKKASREFIGHFSRETMVDKLSQKINDMLDQ